jgi:hypothetical protein
MNLSQLETEALLKLASAHEFREPLGLGVAKSDLDTLVERGYATLCSWLDAWGPITYLRTAYEITSDGRTVVRAL